MSPREEWLKAREKGIGASDAACILGLNPWKSNIELWEEKTGRRKAPDIGAKPAVQYGKEAEALLRSLFALDYPQYRVTYDEYGMIATRPDEPWLFATLDGELEQIAGPVISGRELGVLEIKTAEIMRPSQWADWSDRSIPTQYYCQILHQFLATQRFFAILKAQIKSRDYNNPDPDALKITTKHYYMTINDPGVADDMLHLLKAEREFMDCVRHDRRPALILPEI